MTEPPAELRLGDLKVDLPVAVGTEGERGLDISKLRAQTGLITLDYGFVNTGSTESAITFIDGEAGILRYRGFPIETLAESDQPSFLESVVPAHPRGAPDDIGARRVPIRDPQAHAAARGRQAVLRRLPT